MNRYNLHTVPATPIVHRATFDDRRELQPSVAIATTVANLEETPVCETDFTLANIIDPDALDDLVTATNDVQVTFPLQEYLVVVQGNGWIQIRSSTSEPL